MTPTSRSDHLREVADLLWPPPLRWRIERSPDRDDATAYQEFVVIPSAKAPRLLVPTNRRSAAAAVANSQSGSGARERARSFVLASAFRLGLGPRVFRDRVRVTSPDGSPRPDTALKAHLDQLLGTHGSWALAITRARANRKPVLQVLSETAEPVAFVKVGTNDLTRRLVSQEERSLRWLTPHLARARVPEVLGGGDWHGLALLTLAPLPLRRRAARPPEARIVEAAVEIAEADGVATLALGPSTYWRGLRERLSTVPGTHRDDLLETWDVLDRGAGHLDLRFGAWHGDWAPWNLAWADGTLLVWDLERFEQDVPVGLDFVHLDLQTRILAPDIDAGAAIDARMAQCDRLLAPAGVSQATAPVVFAAYLLEIACRWAVDQQEEAGGSGAILGELVSAGGRAARRAVALVAGEGTT